MKILKNFGLVNNIEKYQKASEIQIEIRNYLIKEVNQN